MVQESIVPIIETKDLCKHFGPTIALDKVNVKIYADGEAGEEIAASLANFAGYVGAQTLALSVEAAPLAEAGDAPEVEWNEGTIRISVSRN